MNHFIKQHKDKRNGKNIQSEASQKKWYVHHQGKQQSAKAMDMRGECGHSRWEEMGERSVGQEWREQSMVSQREYGKSIKELFCFSLILKPPSRLDHKLALPYNPNWLYKFFTPLDYVTLLYFKTSFSCGQQKVN